MAIKQLKNLFIAIASPTLLNGVYLIQTNTSNGTFVKKVIIDKQQL